MKNIPISNKNWRRLRKVRDNLGFQHFNRTIEWLMWQVFSPDKTMITLEQEIFDRLVEIKEDNGYDTIGETICHMIAELMDYEEKNEQEHGGH
jgi:hypothetical protein